MFHGEDTTHLAWARRDGMAGEGRRGGMVLMCMRSSRPSIACKQQVQAHNAHHVSRRSQASTCKQPHAAACKQQDASSRHSRTLAASGGNCAAAASGCTATIARAGRRRRDRQVRRGRARHRPMDRYPSDVQAPAHPLLLTATKKADSFSSSSPTFENAGRDLATGVCCTFAGGNV